MEWVSNVNTEKANSWFFIEFSTPEGIDFDESDIVEVLESLEFKYKYLIDQIVVFDIQNTPDETRIETFKSRIYQLIVDKLNDSEDEFDEELFNFITYKSQEILFSFNIESDDLKEHEFINYLVRIQDGEVINYDKESEFLTIVDYAERHYSKTPLFHNIRCKNIAIFKLKTLSLGFAIIGYMKINNGIRVTIKVFKYDMLKYIIDSLHSFDWILKVTWEDNINWNWLMSRNVSSGYRIADEHITKNELMKSFLKVTKADALEKKISFVLEKLLNKGYLTEKEFNDEISSEKSINKFFSPYHRLISNNFPEKGVWIDPSLGLIFNERNKNDPKRIEENNDFEKIFAPTFHLLNYIRIFWHQDFVQEVVEMVQKEMQAEQSDYNIISSFADLQFDLKRDGEPKSSSRDIDVLLRVKNRKKNTEEIIAIESKRYASEFNTVKKDITQKITQRYAGIFKAFITVAYFNDNNDVNSEEYVVWGSGDQELKRPLFLCANTNFKGLVSNLKETIIKICENNDDE